MHQYSSLEPVIVRKIIALIHLPVRMKQLVTEIFRATDAIQFGFRAKLAASILQKVIEIFRATLVSRLENSVGLLQLATTIPRQVFANQLMLPASILQMATTILRIFYAQG